MILGIETSTPHASLALWDPITGTMVWERTFSSDRAHNSVIFGPLREALEVLAGRGLNGIVLGTGPGSYSGVRVGIAVASALSLARGCRVVGLPSIVALAADALVVGDARRQTYYTAEVRGHRLAAAPVLADEGEFLERVAATPELALLTTDPKPPLDIPAQVVTPSAGVLAQLAAALSESEWAALAELPLEPLYLRAPYITTPNPVSRGARRA
jgi:tRNA threonylcarbamoyladenosine biosynthesis protein TsaB